MGYVGSLVGEGSWVGVDSWKGSCVGVGVGSCRM